MQSEIDEITSQKVTPEWLTEVLRQSGALPFGHVVGVQMATEDTYTAIITRLRLAYSPEAPDSAPTRLFSQAVAS